MRTRAVEGAIVAVDESGHPLEERERIASVMGLIFVNAIPLGSALWD